MRQSTGLLSLHRISEPEQAREFGLKAAEKKESQDFISPEYLPELFSDKPSVSGDIIDIDGHVLGRHNGIEHYTIGQRKGLEISAKYPIYVHSIDAVNNLIVVSKEEDLFSQSFIAEDFVWAGGMIPENPEEIKAKVKIRLAGKPVDCSVGSAGEGKWRINFTEPQKAVSPGQSAVLYSDGVIIGGGVIVSRG